MGGAGLAPGSDLDGNPVTNVVTDPPSAYWVFSWMKSLIDSID